MPHDMADELVTVASYPDLTSAQLYQSLLQENDIPAFLPEENTVGAGDPAFGVAIPEVRLQVPIRDVARAQALLAEMSQRYEKEADGDDEADDPEETESGVPGSISLERLTGMWLYAAVALFLLFAVLFCQSIDWLIALVTH